MTETLQQATQSFLQHCKYEKNLSEKTILFYKLDLKQFCDFIKLNDYPQIIYEINKNHIKHYVRDISNWKIKTIKRKIASLKAMFNYLEYEDFIETNPVRKVKINLKEAIALPKALNKEEIENMIQLTYQEVAIVPKSKYAYCEKIRNATVLELLFSTGARVSEIAGLKLNDINISSGVIKLKGKGNKERIIQICNPDTLALMVVYCDLFQGKITASGGYLLINRLGNKLSDQSIRNLVNAIAIKAKISKKVTPHTFRHSFATLLLENDVDIKYIQSMLGHSSIVTTQIYTQVNVQKQKQLLTDKHPRKEFMLATL
ncbi:integrase/recombinase XerD [Mucilaginibacter oryzae]|uniref:Integrase/recombinase XerD n=1 Tax=Mucilaginibacter oryzae TaxID=468058 RepID=A0A316GXH8_9SPHI|nr:tyrosine-type recombinase/integrase [Mucilaginibacter oryzae]PWK68315.1 integrase/recombinase XerD [Mucilaginibacter oryzae]